MQRGFVRKRGGTWTAYYYDQDPRGRRRQRTKAGFATKRAAQAWLTEALAALQRGVLVEPTRLTVEAYLLTRWLPVMRNSLRPTTFNSYEQILQLHVIPALGQVGLQQLTVDHLDQLYAHLIASGRTDERGGLSPKTVRYIHNTLQKALGDAERKQLVPRNVARAADPPKLGPARREMRTWTATELRTFLAALREHRLYAAFLLAATTGMRRGEVLGLRWRDVDFANRRVLVRQTLTSVNYALSFSEPKTRRSRRSVAIDPVTLAGLRHHRRQQQLERTAFGDSYEDHDLVFAKEHGEPTHPDFFSQTFNRAVARLSIPRIRLHDLRHTYATLALTARVDAKVVSERLGHSTVAFTQDTYMHTVPALHDAAADEVADLIFRGEGA